MSKAEFIEIPDYPARVLNNLGVESFDSVSELTYFQAVTPAIRKIGVGTDTTLLFDVDGTMVCQEYTNGVRSYIRKAFHEAYILTRTLGLKVGIFTLRSHRLQELTWVKDFPYYFDEVLGYDEMVDRLTLVCNNLEGTQPCLMLSNPILHQLGISDLKQRNNPKLLYLAHRIDRYFVIEDDPTVAQPLETLDLGIQVPIPNDHFVK